jgi:hypothetical protein
VSVGAIVAGLGHGLASWGYGGGDGGYASAAVAGWIRITERSKRLHCVDIAEFDLEFLTYDDVLTDPSAIDVEVDPPLLDAFSLEYDDAADTVDRLTRVSEGRYRLRVECTSERGAGIWFFKVTSTGALQAAEPGQFIVRSSRM